MNIPPPAALVENWQSATPPQPWQTYTGDHVSLEVLCSDHVEDLYTAFTREGGDTGWRYLPYGPFNQKEDFAAWLQEKCINSTDPMFVAVRDLGSGRVVGIASYLRIMPEQGVIEVGHIHFSPLLQRTVAATECMFLMMRWAFQHGYRRYEWKCNALNTASRRAAVRLGFSYEGTFYQMSISKGHNRDTAWFAILDWQWPVLEEAFVQWLSPENFDENGKQKVSLSDLTATAHYAKDPGYTPLQERF